LQHSRGSTPPPTRRRNTIAAPSTPGSSAIAKYNASGSARVTTPPNYLVVPLSSDYKSGSSLNTSSNLVRAARAGGSGCTAGITAYGGVGTFYADAVLAAQNYLAANGRAGANKMIILLSDGDATASTPNISSAKATNECHQAMTASTNAQGAGMTVVTIAYGAGKPPARICEGEAEWPSYSTIPMGSLLSLYVRFVSYTLRAVGATVEVPRDSCSDDGVSRTLDDRPMAFSERGFRS
jgi:hypothetical protein